MTTFFERIFPCFRKKSWPVSPPTGPWLIGPIVDGVNRSKGLLPYMALDHDGSYYFDFPVGDGVHYVTKAPVSRPSAINFRYRVEGGGNLIPTGANESGPAYVRLYVQRRGDDWSGIPYRFWSRPLPLRNGENYTIQDFTGWTGVYGQPDEDALQATLADLGAIGFTFGGMFAGHGVGLDPAGGNKRFTLLEFS